MQPFSAHHLMTIYICIKKISLWFSELLSGHVLKFTKGHNSIKNIGGVMVLVLCTSPDNAL